MEIPRLGPLTLDEEGEHSSEPVPVPIFGRSCVFTVADPDGYATEPEAVHRAVAAFLDLDGSALAAAAPDAYEYYRDVTDFFEAEGYPYTRVPDVSRIWEHVTFGPDVRIEREDGRVYLSVECECSWEVEHGLQLVFRDGRAISRIGPYDGHLTNNGTDAIYRS
ncbi:hypothetical protein Ait01nite_010840 [Actinoplanes italicus]|uniref:DUF6985 domain-containing protein n=1 Tax=Actinoplanes italicus TaxID=113567 RepID=A0A2T0KKS1_9ACTN|nr:hypothetical protein [Actinoplanes italicus]PRX24235.1 hypothetical protein CLV67_1029 [Actinoplanes italicus]GIE28039.1 hypothetical protein Ait01nite_010840 [Actinoplanes italicus]